MFKKKTMVALVAAAAIAGLGIGTSVAYMTDHETAKNEFTVVGKDGLNAKLTEPSWDPDKGRLVLPNQTVSKDPQVTNTSDIDLDGNVALKVEFLYSDECPDTSKRGTALSAQDMAYVYDVYDIDWNADDEGDWVRFDGEDASKQTQCFYYKDVVKRNLPDDGDTTVPLFTEVSVGKDVNNERYSHIQEIGGMQIKISGMIVQQMTGESEFGLSTPKDSYEAGLFDFQPEDTHGATAGK